ncbi:hypothetical protein DL766_004599 [Monosporascus sp. MC13-8B]|nr:hypothetical protein DL766_004599 [Monosporascus sp. MC13-8B]
MRLSTIAGTLLAGGIAQAYEIVLYSEEGWSGEEASFSLDGNHQLGFKAHSWEWISPLGDGCCVRFCYNNSPVGYRCSPDANYRSSSPIDEVATGCGENALLDC